MTTNQPKARWPLDMRYTNCCDVRPGEWALQTSPLFLTHKLQLLCGVRLSDLSGIAHDGLQSEQASRSIYDYLVCKEDQILLAICLTDRDPCFGKFVYLPRLPTVESNCESFSQSDVGDILMELDVLLGKKEISPWRCRLRDCPPELRAPLFREMMLEQQENGDTVPTDYGMCNGLVRVIQRDGHSAMCSARTLRNIRALLAAGRAASGAHGAPPSLEVRLNAYRAGLACDEQVNAQLVQEVMDMPLQRYMDGFPEELEELEDTLPGQCATYGDAACAIHELLHSSYDELHEQGVILMRALAAPTLEDEQSAGAVRLGRRVTGRSPDKVPSRYRSGGERMTLHDYMSSTRQQLPPGIRLSFSTQAGFFQGVGALTGSNYPQWRSNTLRDYLELEGRCRYSNLLYTGNLKLLDSRPWFVSFGVHLLYVLLIEPYYLIRQRNRDNPKEDFNT